FANSLTYFMTQICLCVGTWEQAMRASALVSVVGWLAIYFAQSASSLDFGRFCTGLGVGVFSYVVPVFIAEIAPKALRGGLTALNPVTLLLLETKYERTKALLAFGNNSEIAARTECS
uniref:Major facilitator superfamily (MFS) profile domain-containing protein n=1 Tax=Aegilops tauschii subsp. strangulata TaxID=200361 RepID=A0A453PU17_AEGTS